MKKCPNCQAICKDSDFYCLKCNHPLSYENVFLTNNEYDNSNHVTISSMKKESNIPKCPICGSTNLKKLSALNRGTSVFMFGFGSNKIGKTYQCKNCKATF